MRSRSDTLWKLVHSMNSAEKLFFRRNFTNPHIRERSLYLKLFEAVAAQKDYDEARLIQKLGPGLTPKNLAAQKHYLYRQLCDAMLAYDVRNDETHEIYRNIQLIRLMRKKGMLDEAHSIWKKTVLQARRSEAFAFLNLLKSEFGKMILFSGNQSREDELHAIFKGNVVSYDEYRGLLDLRDIYTEVLLIKRKAHFDIDENLRERIAQLLEKVEQNEFEGLSRSFWFRHYFRLNKATLLYMLNDAEPAFHLLDDSWKDWKKHQHYLRSESEYFIEVLYMINYVAVLLGKFDYVEKIFHDSVNESIGNAQRANFEAVKYIALNKIYNKQARYNVVQKLITDVKVKYRQWEPFLNPDMNRTLTLSVGIASLVLEKFDDAIYFIKRGLSTYREGVRKEHESVGNLLLLVCAWSLNNAKYFDAQYRNTYSFFYKRQKTRPYERLLMQCLQKSFYLNDNQKKMALFRGTLQELQKTGDDKIQNMAFNIFNFPGWLTAYIEKTPYRKYVEMNVRKNLTLKSESTLG